jgi:hypothetical protein
MIRIAISPAAFEAIAATCRLSSVGARGRENAVDGHPADCGGGLTTARSHVSV